MSLVKNIILKGAATRTYVDEVNVKYANLSFSIFIFVFFFNLLLLLLAGVFLFVTMQFVGICFA